MPKILTPTNAYGDIGTRVSGDTQSRATVSTDGQLYFGTGSALNSKLGYVDSSVGVQLRSATDPGSSGDCALTVTGNGTLNPTIQLRRSNGTYATPTASGVASGNQSAGQILFAGYTGSGWVTGGYVIGQAIDLWSGSASATALRFGNTIGGATGAAERMRLVDRILAIGGTPPTAAASTNERLRVNTPTTLDTAATLHVATSTTSSKGIVVQGLSGQGAGSNLQEWQDSTGSVLALVSEIGYVTSSKNFASGSAGASTATRFFAGGTSATAANLYGFYDNATHTLSGAGTEVMSFRALHTVDTTASNYALTNDYGMRIGATSKSGSGTITNAYGLYVDAPTVGGTLNVGAALVAAGSQTLWVSSNTDSTTSAAGIAFGSSRDTTLYRSAAGRLQTDGGQFMLGNGTSNVMIFTGAGAAAPAFTTRSAGTKLVLYPDLSSTHADYAFGIEAGALWSGVPTSTEQFKWYAGTTQIASLSGGGNVVFSGTGNFGTNLTISGSAITGAGSSLSVSASGGALNLNANAAGNPQILFNASGTEYARFDTSGNLQMAGTRGVIFGTNPASAGTVRFPNSATFKVRNSGNTADITAISMEGDSLVLSGGASAQGIKLCANNTSGVAYINNASLSMVDAKDIAFSNSTGTKIGTASDQKIGFWGTTAVARSASWSVTAGYTSSKSFDPETASLVQTSRVLGTLVDQLKTYGLLGG
jgi:hypothetical protein